MSDHMHPSISCNSPTSKTKVVRPFIHSLPPVTLLMIIDIAWTTRFTIASATGKFEPAANPVQPNGDRIPWGTGSLASIAKTPEVILPVHNQLSTGTPSESATLSGTVSFSHVRLAVTETTILPSDAPSLSMTSTSSKSMPARMSDGSIVNASKQPDQDYSSTPVQASYQAQHSGLNSLSADVSTETSRSFAITSSSGSSANKGAISSSRFIRVSNENPDNAVAKATDGVTASSTYNESSSSTTVSSVRSSATAQTLYQQIYSTESSQARSLALSPWRWCLMMAICSLVVIG